jgi:hypothetical protein
MNVMRVKDYKRKPDEKESKLFARVTVRRSDTQLDQTLRQLEFRINQIKNFLRIGFDAFYQNAPEACTYKFVTCEYRPLCMAQEKDLIEMIADGNYRQEEWHPYDADGAKSNVEIAHRFEA